ncbi:MAG TPA: DNA double-strand break repair nuclease NurA, partial [Thermomicrobiales bacterium]|nr:DNA double-strand break repair nuclease NurA [Thermomicrobiales bacterium]
MPIDLATIIAQINDMAGRVDPALNVERFRALSAAWEELDSREVNARYTDAKTSFLLAKSDGDYRERSPLPSIPETYSVVATDGSFILPDRHSPARFYVLNLGSVLLSYGREPSADISASCRICYEEHDLVVPDDPQRTRIDGTVLGFRRAIDELQAASDRLSGVTSPAVALQDGTLILWQLQGQTEPVSRWVLGQYLDVLDEFRERDQAIASYISAPGATELMNMLRVSVCDYPDHGMTINC